MENKKRLFGLVRKEEGFTLLEYAAGAAILIATVYVGMNAFGGNLRTFFEHLGSWVTTEQGRLQNQS